MKWIYKLERKYSRFAIHNLMMYIVIAQFVVYMADRMFEMGAAQLFFLDIGRAVGELQLWRFITFIFVPENNSPFWFIIGLLFFYYIGRALEDRWGAFLFNVYYIIGMLGVVLGAVIMYLFTGYGYGTSFYLNLSVFFAYAILHPNDGIRIYFVITVKAKFLALIAAGWMVYNLVISMIAHNWFYVVSAVAAMINLILFFWRDAITNIQASIKYRKTRQNFKNQMNEWEHNKRDQDWKN